MYETIDSICFVICICILVAMAAFLISVTYAAIVASFPPAKTRPPLAELIQKEDNSAKVASALGQHLGAEIHRCNAESLRRQQEQETKTKNTNKKLCKDTTTQL